MSDAPWYRSLYWRIGLGFILFLAAVLVIQGAVIFWLIERGEAAPGPPPRGFTFIVGADLSTALGADPRLDLERYIRDTYEQRGYPFFVLMTDGRVISSSSARPPAQLLDAAKARLERATDATRRFDRTAPPWGPSRGRFGPGGERGFGGRFIPPGDIIVRGQLVGVVIAIPRTFLGEFGPTMAYVAAALVAGGTALAALLIFGPVRRRLRSLEGATGRVAAGDLSARAREDGGDEVAVLARAFNRMTEELGRRADQVQSADRARRLLLADVSHELRTPLTAMRGYLETLSMPELALDADTRSRYVGIVSEETRRLEHIVDDLLDLARLESVGDSIDLQDVPIESLFGRVAARHEREATTKGVTLSSAIAPGAEIVCGDALRLEQALQNLAANALRHSPAGGSVELRAELDRGEVVLSVRDTGPGIPPEHLPFVFERFYKVDPARPQRATGSGLGLSIVKAIVERHGGTISVSSAPKSGSIFTIRLPSGVGES